MSENKAMKNSDSNFYVYILQSLKNFLFYVGQCYDPDRKMNKDFDGMSKFTSGKLTLRLVYFEVLRTYFKQFFEHNIFSREQINFIV